MQIILKEDYKEASQWVANLIIERINRFSLEHKRPFVLGLPTGSTPVGTYKALIQAVKEGRVSFKNVITFNMDEYVGLSKTHKQSYYYFMRENLFDHIDIEESNINIFDGCARDREKECLRYEYKIKEAGGVDLFIGGVGENGHIAFNEPGTSFDSQSHVVLLSESSIKANSRFFNNDLNLVPKKALTVGIKTITSANEVVIIANGKAKANAVKHAVDGKLDENWPITALHLHKNASLVCDCGAAEYLKVSEEKQLKTI